MSQSNQNSEFNQETYRSMIQFATMMIKFCGAVNGGAILALLTFTGNAYKYEQQLNMTAPFIFYAIGITSTGAATIAAYFVQKKLHEGHDSNWEFWSCFIFIILGITCFLIASILAAYVIAG